MRKEDYMKIDKGDIFYRYADDYNDEDVVHEVELYVAVNRCKKKSDMVALVNIETDEMWEIENGEISNTDLVFLTPDYRYSFVIGITNYEECRIICKKKDTVETVGVSIGMMEDLVHPKLVEMFRNTKQELLSNIAGYNFLSREQLELIMRHCFSEDNDVVVRLAYSVFVYNMKNVKAIELEHTWFENERLRCDISDISLDDNPDLKEFEEAIRCYCDPDRYMVFPLTPAYNIDKINRIHKIVKLADNKLYILVYVPIETYLQRGKKEDPEVQEICDIFNKLLGD